MKIAQLLVQLVNTLSEKIKTKMEFLSQKTSSFASGFELALTLGQKETSRIATISSLGSYESLFFQIPTTVLARVRVHVNVCVYLILGHNIQ